MNAAFALVLSMSIGGSVLIAAILLAERVAGRRTSRMWQHYIWLLVIARLLIPFGPNAAVLPGAYSRIAGDAAVQHTDNAAAGEARPSGASGTAADAEAGSVPEASPVPANTPSAAGAPDVWTWIAAIWAIGAVALLVRRITAYQSFQHYVRAGMQPSDRTELLDIVAEAGEKCAVRRPVELAVNPLVSSPLLIGLVHPCIVLPSEDIPANEFRYVAMHELTHLGRLDIIYKWAVQAAVCLHWFNPLVYLMSRRISRACEFACDEAVISRTGSAGPYADALLGAMAAAGAYAEPVGQVQLSASAQMLKERITAMKEYGKKARGSVFVAVLLTACLAAGTACSGVYRTGTWGFPPAAADRLQARTAAPVSDSTISVYADSCLVQLVDSEDGTVHADYDEAYYDVDIIHSGADPDALIRVEMRSLRAAASRHKVTLHMPLTANCSIYLSADASYVDAPDIPHGTISADLVSCYARFNLGTSFDGLLSVNAPDSYVVLGSETDFAGMTVTLDGDAIASPASFRQNSGSCIWSDGDNATIYVSAVDGMIHVAGADTDWSSFAGEVLGVLPEIVADLPDIIDEALPTQSTAPGSSALPEPSCEPAGTAESPQETPKPSAAQPGSLRGAIRDGLRELAEAIFGVLSDEVSGEVREYFHEAARDVHETALDAHEAVLDAAGVVRGSAG